MKPVQIILCALLSFSANWDNGEGAILGASKQHSDVSHETTSPNVTWKSNSTELQHGPIAIGSITIFKDSSASKTSEECTSKDDTTEVDTSENYTSEEEEEENTDNPFWKNRQDSNCVKPIAFRECLPKVPSPIQVCVELESSVLNNFEIVYTCVRVKLSNNSKLDLPCIYIEKSKPALISREEVLATIEKNANIKICNDDKELLTRTPTSAFA